MRACSVCKHASLCKGLGAVVLRGSERSCSQFPGRRMRHPPIPSVLLLHLLLLL